MNINKIKYIANFRSVTNLKNLHLFQPIASNLEANTLTLLGHFSPTFDEGNSMRYSRFQVLETPYKA
ncbi:hypothetical protein SODG_004668 [Sodalis praecaptivus]|nr:hypothetical protein NVIRENTERO_03314 [Sodalis praecaptivus]